MTRITLLVLLGLAPLAQAAEQLVLMPDNFEAYQQQAMNNGMDGVVEFERLPAPEYAPKTLNIYKFSDGEIQFHENYGDGEGGVEVHDYSAY